MTSTPPTPSPARPALVALAAITLFWLAEIAGQVSTFGPGGQLSDGVLQVAVAQSGLVVVGLILGHALVGRMDVLTRSITLVFLVGAVLNLAVWAAYKTAPDLFQSETGWRFAQLAVLVPQIAVLAWLLRAPLRLWLRSATVMAAVFLLTQEVAARFVPVGELYTLQAAEEEAAPDVDVEALYAAQDRLMETQIAGLAPEVPGLPDVFGLFLGGTADQSVFLTEVDNVSAIIDARFGSGPRSVKLANSHDNPMRYPLASRRNLAQALQEIGDRQGPEDLVFLFLTSHGHDDRFALDFPQAGTRDLTAQDLAAMLDASGIGPAVIVVSACFSGSFIDDIAAPDRLIITAARGDRSSFGCRDGAEWTEFGQSFFDLALQIEPDPRKAFALAVADVARKEVEAGLEQSLPQISEGAEIGAVLDRVLATRGATSN
ncbi:MAG: C13 family peptidase [Tabrizicola sp.]|nr:C13 family peptidase [Tabrizicola sp.]